MPVTGPTAMTHYAMCCSRRLGWSSRHQQGTASIAAHAVNTRQDDRTRADDVL